MISRIFIKLDCEGEKTGPGKGRKTPNVKKWKKEHILSGYVWFLWRRNGTMLRNPVLDTSTHTQSRWYKIQYKTQQAHDSRLKKMPMFLLSQAKAGPSYSDFWPSTILWGPPTLEGFPGSSNGQELPATQETWVWSLGRGDPPKEGMATHSGILAWRIPWTEAPGGLHSMGSQRVRQDWVTNTLTYTHIGEDRLFNSGYWLKGISSRNTNRHIQNIVWHPLAQLTHKINHHRSISVK